MNLHVCVALNPYSDVNRNKKCSDFVKKNYSIFGNSLCNDFVKKNYSIFGNSPCSDFVKKNYSIFGNSPCSDFVKKNYSIFGNSLCSDFGNNKAVTAGLWLFQKSKRGKEKRPELISEWYRKQDKRVNIFQRIAGSATMQGE
jgi:hypothetical protein